MKDIKLTGKMEMALKAMKAMGGTGFAREVLEYLEANEAKRVDLKTFNAVNATLAYCVKAGLLTSAKGVYKDKMLTKYSVCDATPSFDVK